MTAPAIETVQRRSPLAVAFFDPLTDAPITDGLVASARPSAATGRFRAGYTTPSGFHVFSGVPGLRDAEFPRPAPGRRAEPDDLPSATRLDVDVLVEDGNDRFLPTVLRLAAPLDGVALAADALAGCDALVLSVPADTPMFLMSSPQRAIPPSTAVVRACLRHHATMVPAAHAVLTVECAGVRTAGVADGHGNVVVTFPYPGFEVTTGPGSIPAGSHGVPTTDQRWSVTADVRWSPGTLSFPAGVDIPRVHTIYCQPAGTIFADDGGAGAATLDAQLSFGVPLVLETAGATDPDRRSYLFVEPAP